MNINEIRSKTIIMAGKVYTMLELIEKGFMENKPEPLTKAMEEESAINEMEKTLTQRILELSRTTNGEKDRTMLATLEGTVEMLERMGDEASNLVERIEIKVHEKLLFSDIGVEQFNETYKTMKKSADMMRQFLKKPESDLKDRIIENGFRVKDLVERFRKEHTDRLIKGLCTPMGANMYFDMLDYTGNLARHSSSIVKLFE